LAGFFLEGVVPVDPALLRGVKGLDDDEAVRRALTFTAWSLDALSTWDAAAVEGALRGLAERSDIKLRTLLAPVFVAVSGRRSATPLFDTMAHLGRDLCRARLRAAADALGGVSGKEEKRWRKEFDASGSAAPEGEEG
jgi:glutamyl-tRNA synthetase